MSTENKKLQRFHDALAAGQYLILVYVRRAQEAAIRRLMDERHAEAGFVGSDTHLINPFRAPAAKPAPRSAT
jgi:hypothetical protein